MTSLKKRQWTVFFLIKAVDGQTIVPAIQMLDQLMQINFPDEIAIILCINFDRNNLEALLKIDPTLVKEHSDSNFTAIFFKITTIEGGHRNTLSVIAEKRDFDITNDDDISSFLKERILKIFEAKRYLLFTWDHGNAFGIFSGKGQGSEEKVEEKIIRSKVSKSILTMQELNNAITKAFHNKIDLIIMMNCYMQVFDTGYALRNNVKFLIAPETFMGFLDYDYRAIFLCLSDNPQISARKLATFTIKSFKLRSIPSICISFCKLKYFNHASLVLNDLAESLIIRIDEDEQKIETNKVGIEIKVRECFSTSNMVDDGLRLVDLYSLLTKLKVIGNEKEQMLINNLFLLKGSIINKLYAGVLIGPQGISILSPVRVKSVITEEDEILNTQTEFLRTKWGRLFHKLSTKTLDWSFDD